MKKIIITILAIVCMISFTVVSSHAGSSKRHRHHLEGFILGSGAGFIGAAIINKLQHDRPRHHKRYHKRHHGRYCGNRCRCGEPTGHWKIKRIWVPEEYEERWNPGHYNKRGRWVCGKYERFVVREGYWKEKRIWVCYY
ncbi:MAG: hypothetical protein KAR45_10220 [Desulfobacteraceae bacterium]|nr:hypothetical protein [Desulfobacteraceae bacterium]